MRFPTEAELSPRMPHAKSMSDARLRQSRLTKPAGALGELENIAITLAAHQRRECPVIEKPEALIFAADHGIAGLGVSAYPPTVTAQMVLNFLRGGAAISVLAKHHDLRLTVVDAGVAWGLSGLTPPESNIAVTHSPDAGDRGTSQNAHACSFVRDSVSSEGTAAFVDQPAMTEAQLRHALLVGQAQIKHAHERGCDVLLPGEMGIGNTTAATAIACVLLDQTPEALAGRGTGVTDAGLQRKVEVLQQALRHHEPLLKTRDPMETLRCVGGFEIAALTGAMLAAAQAGITVLVDGFIVSVAALVACRIQPGCRDWMLFAHQSAEAGHNAVLTALEARALMNLGMRLGEGSGAAVALPLLRMACALHAGMATFEQAGVDTQASGHP